MVSLISRLAVAFLVTLSLAAAGATPVAAQNDQPAWADELFTDLQDM